MAKGNWTDGVLPFVAGFVTSPVAGGLTFAGLNALIPVPTDPAAKTQRDEVLGLASSIAPPAAGAVIFSNVFGTAKKLPPAFGAGMLVGTVAEIALTVYLISVLMSQGQQTLPAP